jgi:acyl carrier protein
MQTEEIRHSVRKIVSDVFELAEDHIDDAADFTRILGGDSLIMVGLIVALEKHFDIHYSPTEAQSFACVDDIVRVTGNYVTQ